MRGGPTPTIDAPAESTSVIALGRAIIAQVARSAIASRVSPYAQLTTTEVAERAGLSRTAARRYLLSLVHFGYAATDGKQFWLAPRVLRLGQSYLGAARLPRLVQPFIQRVAVQIGHTANASVLDGHEVVYIARSSPPRKGLFRAQVRQAKALGYWHTEQQLDAGLRGVAVALIDRKGRCRGAVGTTMPMTAYRSSEHMLDSVLPPLQEAAQGVRSLL